MKVSIVKYIMLANLIVFAMSGKAQEEILPGMQQFFQMFIVAMTILAGVLIGSFGTRAIKPKAAFLLSCHKK